MYAVSVTFIYGWTIYWFLWKLPSWSYYLSINEIFLIAVYSAAVNFFESLMVFWASFVLVLIFPKKWFFDRFLTIGSLLSMLIGGSLIYFSSIAEAAKDFSYSLLAQAVLLFAVSVCLAVLAGRVHMISTIVELLADRLKVFLYISVPVSLLSILLIVIRNIFG